MFGFTKKYKDEIDLLRSQNRVLKREVWDLKIKIERMEYEYKDVKKVVPTNSVTISKHKSTTPTMYHEESLRDDILSDPLVIYSAMELISNMGSSYDDCSSSSSSSDSYDCDCSYSSDD